MPLTTRDAEFTATITFYYGVELGRAPDPGGLASWLGQLRNGMTGPQLQQALHDSPEGVAFRGRPPVLPPTPLQLAVRGADFVHADGSRRVFCGTDQFTAFRLFLDGVDLTPLLMESQALGFDLWRVFLMGSVHQNGILQLSPSDSGYADALRMFADVVNAAGIVLLATVFVDAQDIMPAVGQRIDHWHRVADRLRGTQTLLSGGNEWSKNGFNPGELTDPGLLWSRGSDVGDAAPYRPYGSFAEFHPRRDLPAALMDTVASPVFIRGKNSLTGPLLIDEPPRMGLDGSAPEYADPAVCWKFARHYATECSGAIFHARPGQRGQLMDPVTRACAEAWVRGMRI